MNLNVLTPALAATAFGAIAANAQTTVIEERRDPSVTIQTEMPATSSTTTVKERGGLLGTEKKSTTVTTGVGVSSDCNDKTVHKLGLTGDKTVSKTTCD